MRTSTISTLSVSLALRGATARLQRDLPDLQTEVTTGKYADSGLALGAQSRNLAAYVGDVDHYQRLIDTNEQIGTRLTASQAGMGQLNELANQLVNAIGIVMGDPSQYSTAQQTASNTVAEVSSILNSQVNGVFVFGGQNVDNQPLNDYATGPGKVAFDNAFLTYFGFDKNDPAAAALTRTDIENFITAEVEPLFMGAGWTANMSSATDEVVTARISANVTAETSVSANEDGFRRLMMAAVTASELFDSNLGAEALVGVSNFAIENGGSSAGEITKIQGKVGLVENRMERVNEALTQQKSLFQQFAAGLESVDSYDAGIQLNTLLTQIEVSYQITSRMQNMSLLNYL